MVGDARRLAALSRCGGRRLGVFFAHGRMGQEQLAHAGRCRRAHQTLADYDLVSADAPVNAPQHLGHFLSLALGQGDHADVNAVVLSGLVELLDYPRDFGQLEVFGDDRKRVGVEVGLDDGLILSPQTLVHRVEFQGDLAGVGVIQPDVLNVSRGALRSLVQILDQAFDQCEICLVR